MSYVLCCLVVLFLFVFLFFARGLSIWLERNGVATPGLGKEWDPSIKPEHETPYVEGCHCQCHLRAFSPLAVIWSSWTVTLEFMQLRPFTLYTENDIDTPPRALCYFHRLFSGGLRDISFMISGTTLAPTTVITWRCLFCCAGPLFSKTQ